MTLQALTLLFIFIRLSCGAVIRDEAPKCGYETCHSLKDGFINVHLVPHTHDDVGWLKTVDQYFYGANNSIQNAGVQYILDSVVDELSKNPDRRFIYVETSFFWKWWMRQDDATRHQFKTFVNNGQLEFVGGGWVMNDEATAHYQSIIDQFTWGLRKLNDTFGECGRPKAGWQIDPFGHSREMASLFAQMGYDGLMLGRIDFQDKNNRFSSKTPEMVWKASSNLGDNANIFTGAMYNTYAPPSGFCFDILCDDEPLIDDTRSPLYNIDRRIDSFFAYLDNVTKVYTTDNLILTMGEDFNYQDAHTWFKNLDILIHYANLRQNNGSKYNLIYSTPSCYIKAVHDSKKSFIAKSDDFFPYASDGNSFWTGYFSSRPTIKRFERESNNFLQICKQLYALADLGPEDKVDLNVLREAMGVMQHHDAITGTEKQHVADDYARLLTIGLNECENIVNAALSKIITRSNSSNEDPTPKIEIKTCPLLNTSSCLWSENQDEFIVTVYNPSSQLSNKYVRLPVLGQSYTVKDPSGKELIVQLIPTPESILKIPGRESNSTVELVFLAEDLPPLGFKSYIINKKEGNDIPVEESGVTIATDELGLKISSSTGLLTDVIMNGKTVQVAQNFFYYEGFVGNNYEAKNRSSGAYIFRPLPDQDATAAASSASYKIYRGELIQEIQQTFNGWISQTIRLYNRENYIEFDWVVGPIPDSEVNGKEIINRFSTNLNNTGIFYTDSNGRELLKRTLNARPTWPLVLEEPIAGNYYPITSKIVITDVEQDVEFAILTDRAQGGSSLADGQVELMVHRKCIHDDAFGVGEALQEMAFGNSLVARGKHYLILGPKKNSSSDISTAAQERVLAQKKILEPWIFFSATYNNSSYLTQFSGLKRSLPENLQILTLEPWIGFSFLLRLEHILEKEEDSTLSQPVTINLQDIFEPFTIAEFVETTLAANQRLKDNNRMEFDILDENRTHKRAVVVNALDDFEIVLNPMEIRTFIINVKKT